MNLAQKIPVDTVVDYKTREAWLAARKAGVGASESAALFDLSPWHSRLSLWVEKSGLMQGHGGPERELLEWGRLLETPIAERYGTVTKRELWSFSDYCIAEHPQRPYMRATPDRWILSAPDRPGSGTLQIKTTGDPDAWVDGPPPYVQCQIQHELAVTGRDWAACAVLINGRNMRHWDIERNEAFIAELEEQCAQFWECVERGTPPPVDGHKATLQALKRMHPMDDGSEIALPREAEEWWDLLQTIKERTKGLEKEADQAEAQLRSAIGPATFGKLPGGRTLSLKHTTVKAHVVNREETTYRSLREVKSPSAARKGPRKGSQ
jgi:putative phage-type endonuclease